jgi:hypothetical protein
LGLKDLLDFKQKQANVVEARSLRHQAEETTVELGGWLKPLFILEVGKTPHIIQNS